MQPTLGDCPGVSNQRRDVAFNVTSVYGSEYGDTAPAEEAAQVSRCSSAPLRYYDTPLACDITRLQVLRELDEAPES